MEPQTLQGIDAVTLKDRVQRDPIFHIERVQGITTLEPYQHRIARAVAEHERVAISAAHDLGKTWLMSKLVLWIGSSFPGAKIITTAPTFNQVKRLLWSEIRTGFQASKFPLGGEMLSTEWKISSDWFAIGFSPQKSSGAGEGQGTASSFQGFHGAMVVIVFDEATGIPKSIWDQAEGMLTSGHVRFVAIGNPTSRASEFFQCFKSPAWHKIHLSCFDSPNLIANGITDLQALIRELDLMRELPEGEQQARLKGYKIVQPKLLSTSWVVAMALKWGLDHPLFVSKVLGKFPDEDDHVLISLGTVEQAQAREYQPRDTDKHSIGVDVARFGSDKTVITQMHGLKVFPPKVFVKRETTDIAGQVVSLIREIPKHHGTQITVVVDATGVGSGVVDSLNEAQRNGAVPSFVEIREVHFGGGVESDEDKKLYLNRKAKMFVRLSQALRENVCLPDDNVYLEELPTVVFKFDSKGRYVIESKDEYKRRTGRPSPDHADSLALAFDGLSGAEGVGRFEMRPALGRTIAGARHARDQW